MANSKLSKGQSKEVQVSNSSKVAAQVNPKLMQKALSNGETALYLEYYLGRVQVYDEDKDEVVSKVKRRKEYLELRLIKAKNPMQRQENKDTLAKAEEIRKKRQDEFVEQREGFIFKKDAANLYDIMTEYFTTYSKPSKRILGLAIRRFKDFINCKDNKEYNVYKDVIRERDMSKKMMEDFKDYLCNISKGSGALTSWKRLSQIFNAAVESGKMRKNPLHLTKAPTDASEDGLVKDVLSEEELTRLLTTRLDRQSPEIRRAFIFSLFTGTRFCDVENMKYSNIDYNEKTLNFCQIKTKKSSSKSWVHQPLREDLLALIGEPKTDKPDEEYIFHLPSFTMCLKSIDRWVKAAKIDKHISWHCARHTFATTLLVDGVDLKTVSELMGHTKITMTAKYLHTANELKAKALAKLPNISVE
jgi:integrase/recombinase XerD